MTETEQHARRTSARLECQWGEGCRWSVKTADADKLALAWLNHSRKHWHLPSVDELPNLEPRNADA